MALPVSYYTYIIIQNLYLYNYSDSVLTTRHRCIVGLNNVRREILSSVTIVFYDKVRGWNKAQR